MALELIIERRFKTSVEKLYQAWVQPELIAKWFAPGTMTVPEAQADAISGGKYRIVMENKDGEQFIVNGQYKEVVVNKKLAFDWRWENGDELSLVIVEMSAITDSESELKITHTGFSNEESKQHHNEGWLGCLQNLETKGI